MELEIISPDKIVFSGSVTSVTLPGTLGGLQILQGHAPLITSLKQGEIIFVTTEGEKRIKIDSGFAEIKSDVISVCIEKVLGID